MNNQENKQSQSSQSVDRQDKEQNIQKPHRQPQIDPTQVVTPSEDLVYKGGYTNDPEEILSNPAVAPEMLDDRRDTRTDLTRDSNVD